MLSVFNKFRKRFFGHVFAWGIIIAFFSQGVFPRWSYASNPALSSDKMISLTSKRVPVLLKGLRINVDNPFSFEFIVDSGDGVFETKRIKKETDKLVKYFLASLTIPEEDMWVNLSPYEKDRIISEDFGQTEMGVDLLGQDYLLKQLSSSLLHPEGELGKEFWDKVYKKAYVDFKTTDLPVDTFNKVWIVPDKADVVERDNTVFVVDSHLTLMLEKDYVAMANQKDIAESRAPARDVLMANQKATAESRASARDVATEASRELDVSIQNDIEDGELKAESSGVFREIILPAIEDEVNNGEHFEVLRQMYHSLILATWYKKSLKESILSQVYVDQGKTAGVNIDDKEVVGEIYNRYVDAYREGVFNFIKEDVDVETQKVIPRKYFSGGAHLRAPVNKVDVSTVSSRRMQPRGELLLAMIAIEGVFMGDKGMVARRNDGVFSVGNKKLPQGIYEITPGYDEEEGIAFVKNFNGREVLVESSKGSTFGTVWRRRMKAFLPNSVSDPREWKLYGRKFVDHKNNMLNSDNEDLKYFALEFTIKDRYERAAGHYFKSTGGLKDISDFHLALAIEDFKAFNFFQDENPENHSYLQRMIDHLSNDREGFVKHLTLPQEGITRMVNAIRDLKEKGGDEQDQLLPLYEEVLDDYIIWHALVHSIALRWSEDPRENVIFSHQWLRAKRKNTFFDVWSKWKEGSLVHSQLKSPVEWDKGEKVDDAVKVGIRKRLRSSKGKIDWVIKTGIFILRMGNVVEEVKDVSQWEDETYGKVKPLLQNLISDLAIKYQKEKISREDMQAQLAFAFRDLFSWMPLWQLELILEEQEMAGDGEFLLQDYIDRWPSFTKNQVTKTFRVPNQINKVMTDFEEARATAKVDRSSFEKNVLRFYTRFALISEIVTRMDTPDQAMTAVQEDRSMLTQESIGEGGKTVLVLEQGGKKVIVDREHNKSLDRAWENRDKELIKEEDDPRRAKMLGYFFRSAVIEVQKGMHELEVMIEHIMEHQEYFEAKAQVLDDVHFRNTVTAFEAWKEVAALKDEGDSFIQRLVDMFQTDKDAFQLHMQWPVDQIPLIEKAITDAYEMLQYDLAKDYEDLLQVYTFWKAVVFQVMILSSEDAQAFRAYSDSWIRVESSKGPLTFSELFDVWKEKEFVKKDVRSPQWDDEFAALPGDVKDELDELLKDKGWLTKEQYKELTPEFLGFLQKYFNKLLNDEISAEIFHAIASYVHYLVYSQSPLWMLEGFMIADQKDLTDSSPLEHFVAQLDEMDKGRAVAFISKKDKVKENIASLGQEKSASDFVVDDAFKAVRADYKDMSLSLEIISRLDAPDKAMMVKEANSAVDNAQLVAPESQVKDNAAYGGIDLDTNKGFDLKIDKSGGDIQFKIDPQEMERIRKEGVDGFIPIIIDISPIKSLFPLLGLEENSSSDPSII